MVASITNIVEVDPARGNDAPTARPRQPYKTLTAALAEVRSPTLVQLAAGFYGKASGEQFPIQVPTGVILHGAGRKTEQSTVISGGGPVDHFGGMVALVLTGNAQVRGVGIRNSLGSGILILQGNGLIRDCQINRCSQHGLVILDGTLPQVLATHIQENGGHAILYQGQAKGVVEDCILLRCQTGICLEDQASPLIQKTLVSGHETGIWVKGASRPVLRNNRLIQNRKLGLWLQDTSQVDLGHPQAPAGNIIRHNGQADIQNQTAQPLVAVGNDLLPQHLRGPITLAASRLPDAVAIPPTLLQQPFSSQPVPSSTRAASASEAASESELPEQSPSTTGITSSRFADVQGHWAAAYIEALANRGLVKGFDNGLYHPNEAINRAQFAAMVAASFQAQPTTKPATRFVDVPGHHWASNAIAQAQRQGFVSGFPDDTFRPNQPMARVQAIVAISRGLRLPSAAASALSLYRDRAQIPSYATDAIAAATQKQLIINHPQSDQLRPLEPITRAEVAGLIYQGLVVQGTVAPLDNSPKRVRPVQADIPQGSFPDIQNHWAQPFIQALLNKQLVRGYDDGRFYPDRSMTRAQFAAVIQGAFQPVPRRSVQAFRDVPVNYWAAQAIQSAYRGGFLSGFPDGSFGPDSAIVRVQIWVALINGLNLLPNQKGHPNLLSRYVDRQSIPGYALDAMAKATQLKLVVNAPDIQQLKPNQVATRADISAAVYQTLVHLNRAPRLNHPLIVYP